MTGNVALIFDHITSGIYLHGIFMEVVVLI